MLTSNLDSILNAKRKAFSALLKTKTNLQKIIEDAKTLADKNRIKVTELNNEIDELDIVLTSTEKSIIEINKITGEI